MQKHNKTTLTKYVDDGVGHCKDAALGIQSFTSVRALVWFTRLCYRENTVARDDPGLLNSVLCGLHGGRGTRRVANRAPVQSPDDQRRRHADSRALDGDRFALLHRQFARWRARHRRQR